MSNMSKMGRLGPQLSPCFSGKITISAGVRSRPDVSSTQMNRSPGPSGDYLTRMTSPSSQDNLTPGGDVMVQNQEDDVYRNAYSGRSDTSGAEGGGGHVRRRVRRNSRYADEFSQQRDTQTSVFHAGIMAT